MLDNIPKLIPGTQWLWTAWQDLASRRLRFPQPQPVQITEINAYAQYLGIFGTSDHDLLLGVIAALDRFYIETWEREAATARKKHEQAQKSRQRQQRSRRRR